uniref:Uncharacterized protein n=1 Tax=Megaviridae environmental sample TaxID=1737588 RepID=A0A5J6VMI6_9VIRU|nr:MAG: hypothetical protein [Megaviridae environmental sample]
MSIIHPYKLKNLNLDNIIYSDVKSTNDKTIVYLKYRENNINNRLVFQTPYLYFEKNISDNTLSVPIVCKNEKKRDCFLNSINLIEDKILKDSKQCYTKWFESFSKNNKITYHTILKKSNNIIKLKVYGSNKFKTILRCNNKNITINKIPEVSWLRSIIEIYAIWITDKGFGLVLKPIHISLSPLNNINYKYYDDSDNNSDNNSENNSENTISTTKSDIFIKQSQVYRMNSTSEDFPEIKKITDTLTSS